MAEICERNGHKIEPSAAREPRLDIFYAKYGENLQALEIPMTEASIAELVGGQYEVTPLRYKSGKVAAVLICGDNGVAVCGIKGDIITNLHPYTAQIYKRELSPVEPQKIEAVRGMDMKSKERSHDSR